MIGGAVCLLTYAEPELYPAVSLYNKDDQLSLVSTDYNSTTLYSIIGGTSSAERIVYRIGYLCDLLQHLAAAAASSPRQSPLAPPQTATSWDLIIRHVWKRWRQWQRGELKLVFDSHGQALELNTSREAMQHFGLSAGDEIRLNKGTATVLGARSNMLCYRLDKSPSIILFWSLKTIRDILSRPRDFPISYRSPEKQSRSMALRRLSDVEALADDVSESTLTEWYSRWTPEMDAQLCLWLGQVADRAGVLPYHLDYQDVLAPPLEDAYLSLAGTSLPEIRARGALLLHVNIMVLSALPSIDLTLSTQAPSPAWLIATHRGSLFPCLKGVVLSRLVKATTSLPYEAAEETSKIQPTPTVHVVLEPKETANDDPKSKQTAKARTRVQAVFTQVAAQMTNWPSTLLRQHHHGSKVQHHGMLQERVFDLQLNGEDVLDQDAAYRALFYHLGSTVTSEAIGMFCPVSGGTSDVCYIPNSAGWTDATVRYKTLPDVKGLALFRILGQLMGIAVRTQVAFPIQLTEEIWGLLVGETMTDEDCPTPVEKPSEVADTLKSLSDLTELGVTDADIPRLFPDGLPWVVPLQSGHVVSLAAAERRHKGEGAGVQLTSASISSAQAHARLGQVVRGAEHLLAVAAMKAGLASVVPVCLMPLLTGTELRMLVHGRHPTAYVQILKDRVVYSGGATATHPTVQVLFVPVSLPQPGHVRGDWLTMLLCCSPSSPLSQEFFEAVQMLPQKSQRQLVDLLVPLSQHLLLHHSLYKDGHGGSPSTGIYIALTLIPLTARDQAIRIDGRSRQIWIPSLSPSREDTVKMLTHSLS